MLTYNNLILDPGGWVRCGGPSRPTHLPGGQHLSEGCCPPHKWAETNYPSVINQLPARASPFLSMTEATSIPHPPMKGLHRGSPGSSEMQRTELDAISV